MFLSHTSSVFLVLGWAYTDFPGLKQTGLSELIDHTITKGTTDPSPKPSQNQSQSRPHISTHAPTPPLKRKASEIADSEDEDEYGDAEADMDELALALALEEEDGDGTLEVGSDEDNGLLNDNEEVDANDDDGERTQNRA